MYQVEMINDGVTLLAHDPYAEIKERHLKSGVITKAINEFDSFVFDILPDNVAYAAINPLRTIVKVNNITEKTEKVFATNLIANGDFSNGTTGWIGSSATISVQDSTLTITGNGAAATDWAYQNYTHTLNHKYYLTALVRVLDSGCVSIRSRYGDSTATAFIQNNPVAGTWYRASNINLTVAGDYIYFIQDYNSTSSATGKRMEVKNAMMIDLTATFGAGNEPTAAQMDEMLSQFDNSWFDGTAEISSLKTLESRYDFIGRVLLSVPQMEDSGLVYTRVTCESRMAYLCDSIQPYHTEVTWAGDENTTGLQAFIDYLLDIHNAQVEDDKKIYRGTVTMPTNETNNNVTKGTNYENTWEILKSKLIGVFGGEMLVREFDGLLYLDYVAELGETRSTEIRLARNMKSVKREVDPTGIVTRLIPLGAKIKTTSTSIDEYGNQTETETETEERLTIRSVNDDVPYIIDTDAEAIYGRVYGTVEFDDVTTAAALLTKGETWLAENNLIQTNHAVTAVDLSLIGLDIDDFTLYDEYPVKNELVGIDTTLRIVKQSIDINNPSKSSFEMGKTSTYLSDLTNAVKTNLQTVSEALSVIKTVATNGDAEIRGSLMSSVTYLVQTLNSITASVEQTTESASDYAQFKQIVRNILQMDADGTTMLFQTILEQIATVRGNESTHYNNLIKYIRFVDGKIILGIQGDPFAVEISNTRISFKQNTVEVAYLSNNNLYIGNAIIKSGGKMQLGNFAFVPRSNGSLSLLKVGDVV